MNNNRRNFARLTMLGSLLAFCLTLAAACSARAASWSGIEPYKSNRVDVEKILGTPQKDQMEIDSTLYFHVVGGTAIVSFVDAKFANTKHLDSKLIGTVKGIVLQHEGGSDTPESLKLVSNHDFQREENRGVVVFRNLKDGVAYTFIEGKLRSSYFFPGGGQLPKTKKS